METQRPFIGPDQGGSCLQKYFTGKDGKDYEKVLCSKPIEVLAATPSLDKFLLKLGDREILCPAGLLANKNSFIQLISPESYYASSIEHEEIKAYLLFVYNSNPNKKILADFSNTFGRIKDEDADFWITSDFIIDSKSPPIMIPDSRMMNLSISNKIYHIDLTSISPEILPRVNPHHEVLDLPELLDAWTHTYNCLPLLYAVLGYFAACMFMPEVKDAKQKPGFPLLGIIGTTQMGKTALLQVLYNFWGLPYKPSNYPETSAFVEIMQLCQASCFPIWRDEFRNIKHAPHKESYLRSLYDRGPIAKGTADQKLKLYSPKGTLLLTGEDIIKDPAARRRFVIFQMEDGYKLSESQWHEVIPYAEKYFEHLFLWFIRRGWKKEVFQKIMSMDLVTDNVAEEEKVLYAALGAVAGEEYGLKAVGEANTFWAQKKLDKDGLTQRFSAVDSLFDFLQNLLTIKGFYTGKTYGQSHVPAEIHKYINKSDNGIIRIYLWGLIKLAYAHGFDKETDLGAPAIRSMCLNCFGVKTKSIRLGSWIGQGVEVFEKDITSANLREIIENAESAAEIDLKMEIGLTKNTPW